MPPPPTTARYDVFARRFSARKLLALLLLVKLRALGAVASLLHWVLRLQLLRRLALWLNARARDENAMLRDLPPVTHYEVDVTNVEFAVPNTSPQVVLKGNLSLPKGAGPNSKFPAILIRTPYDKDAPLLGPGLVQVFAERGYAVLIQDTRGRFGSGGDFFPIAHERVDGGASVDWLRRQPWCNGKVGTWGISYLGLTAYAAAGTSHVDACVPIMASSRLYPIIFNGGSAFAFDLVVRWLWLVMNVMHVRNPFKALNMMLAPGQYLEKALHPGTKPISHRDQDIVGKELVFYREVYQAQKVGHEFWKEKDVLCDLENNPPPLSIVAGWHDFFVAQSFKDFDAATRGMKKTKTPVTMVVGDWCHWHFLEYARIGYAAAFELFDAHMKNNNSTPSASAPENAVRIDLEVIHSKSASRATSTWLSFTSWPPLEHTSPKALFLGAAGKLGDAPAGEFSANVFDPEQPTPNVGGPSFDWFNSGPMEQSTLEARNDVCTFSTPPLQQDIWVVGIVRATIHLWSSNPHTDLFIKVCDVNTSSSYNVMEKMTRLCPDEVKWDAQGFAVVEVDVGPIAVRFAKGNVIRIQISGGAHPLYLRHHGTDDHMGADLRKAERKIFHSQARPSVLSLPVLTSPPA